MTGFFTPRRRLRDLLTDESGVTMVYTGILIPVFLGIVGLAAEVAVSHSSSRDARTIADAAAFAGALETARSANQESVIEAAALAEAVANGYDASSGDQIFIECRPTSGPAAGDPRAVEVIIQRPPLGLFAGLIGAQSQNISARSVAKRNNFGTCVFALNPTDSGAVKVNGSSEVSFPCGIQVNSSDPSALIQSGATSAIYSTEYIDVVGGYSGTGFFPTPNTGVPVEPDPLADTPIPTYSCADDGFPAGTVINHSGSTTYDPWIDGNGDGMLVLCGNFKIAAGATVTFQKGLYVFGEGLSINGGATLNGAEVTLYFAPHINDDIDMAGGAIGNLSAPPDGPYAGMLIFQDPNKPAPLSVTSMTGGATQILDGIVYLPKTTLNFNGGSAIEESPTMLIADTIDFSGSSFLGDPATSVAGQSALLVTASFVE